MRSGLYGEQYEFIFHYTNILILLAGAENLSDYREYSNTIFE